jgi:hypothetical protein
MASSFLAPTVAVSNANWKHPREKINTSQKTTSISAFDVCLLAGLQFQQIYTDYPQKNKSIQISCIFRVYTSRRGIPKCFK